MDHKKQLARLASRVNTDVDFQKLVSGAEGVLCATINYMPKHPSMFQGIAIVGTLDSNETITFSSSDL